jgi:three-Cys-motif partner protein
MTPPSEESHNNWISFRGSAHGLYLPTIKAHSLDKIRLHNYYAQLFTQSMKRQWPQRTYLGLYAGAGRARLDPGGEIIETSAMNVFRLRDTFTKFIFVDADPRCSNALRARIEALPARFDYTIVDSDVNDSVPAIRGAMPRFSKESRMIAFSFVDPFAISVLEELSAYRMDFLVLLMLGRDARTNWQKYLNDPADNRIAELLGDPEWRSDWHRSEDQNVIRFVARKFNEGMARFGYDPVTPEEMRPVRLPGKNVLQYYLVLYSKHPLAKKFWRSTIAATASQTALEL